MAEVLCHLYFKNKLLDERKYFENKLLLNENFIFRKLGINNVSDSLWALPLFQKIVIKKPKAIWKAVTKTMASILKHEMSLSENVKPKQKPISHLAMIHKIYEIFLFS